MTQAALIITINIAVIYGFFLLGYALGKRDKWRA